MKWLTYGVLWNKTENLQNQVHQLQEMVTLLTPIWSGGGISPHLYFLTVAARRTEKSGGHVVCKSKLLHWEDTQKGFRSKKILWPGPEGVEVGPAENSGAMKSKFFISG